MIGEIAQSVLNGTYDLVLASRTRGEREPGAMLSHQVFAGRVAGFGIGALYGGAGRLAYSGSATAVPVLRWGQFEGPGLVAWYASSGQPYRGDVLSIRGLWTSAACNRAIDRFELNPPSKQSQLGPREHLPPP